VRVLSETALGSHLPLSRSRSRVALLLLASATGGISLQEIAASSNRKTDLNMRSTKRTSIRTAIAVCAVIGAIYGFGATSAVAATPPPTATSAPPEGHWVALNPVTASTSSVPKQVLTKGSCPKGTTNYSGAKHPYSCLAVFFDGSHHQVGLRIGRSGSENSAFGYLHALQDHNVEE
jgi:hypothetical protein